MGHIQKMTPKQKIEWFIRTYNAKKKANLGYNFQYFNQQKWDKLEADNYKMYIFKDSFGKDTEGTKSVLEAKKVVEILKNDGNYARIICGYIKDVQRTKYFTVIYKPKLKFTPK